MYKYYIISVFAVLFNYTEVNAFSRDSIGVENYNGKKLVIHKVAAKDTYYSIARRYNVVPKDIMAFNDSKYLQIGVIVKVPTNSPFTGNVIPNSTNSTGTAVVLNFTEHTIQRKENLNMLAEKYGTTVNEIKKLNNLSSINLQIGQVLKIPAQTPDQATQVTENQTPAAQKQVSPIVQKPVVVVDRKEPAKQAENIRTPAATETFLEHIVASNETIYSIATRYNLTMDQLKAKNNLTNSSLTVGQKLLVKGQYPPKPAYRPSTVNSGADTLNSIKDPSLRYPASRYGLNQIDEKGTAVWIIDPDLDPSKMLVLHRTAPIGTVMKITNPMSNRSTFAKVVGKFTENESTKDVIIVMTKAVADALGALDKRFFCNIMYGGQENEQK